MITFTTENSRKFNERTYWKFISEVDIFPSNDFFFALCKYAINIALYENVSQELRNKIVSY